MAEASEAAEQQLDMHDAPGRSRYEAMRADDLAALIAYQRSGSRIALMHTETQPGFEGKGFASRLIRFALADARKRSLEVLPFCPFVNEYLRRHAEDVDLVPADQRAAFGL